MLNPFTSKKTQKSRALWLEKNIVSEPLVSIVIQTHNKSKNVILLIESIRKYCSVPFEIIVCEDGSDLKKSFSLYEFANRSNEFILRSNDLYEVITYDRAIYFSRGKYVALIQDDDDYPDDQWITNAIKHFTEHSGLAILGGRDGVRFVERKKDASGSIGPYVFENNVGFRTNLFKFEVTNLGQQNFKFVQCVNRAPMWINRELFLSRLTHIDQTFAPFQHDDAELCLRTWMSGLKVGLYSSGVHQSKLGEGGMRIWNKDFTDEQDKRNAEKIYQQYSSAFIKIDEFIQRASDHESSNSDT